MREKIAEIQHAIWSHWMKYLFSKCYQESKEGEFICVIDGDCVERWKRQMNTSYSDLTEKEKESDRHQADKVLPLLHEAN